MTEFVRACIRIPEDYQQLLDQLMKFEARVIGASVSYEEYEDFFAWHVDEMIDVHFACHNREDADAKISLFFQECEKIGLPSALSTTSVYESIEDKTVTGILYHNETGAFSDIRARTTAATSCTEVPVRQAFYESGMSKERIDDIWTKMSSLHHSMAMAANS